MKKIITGVFAVSLMALATSSWAFTSKSSTTVTAQIAVGGGGSVGGATFQLFSYNTGSGSTSPVQAIGWPSGLDPSQLTNTWVLSTSTIKIVTNITDFTGGVQIVTDNKGPFANPTFYDPTPTVSSNTDSNPAGLVLATGTASSFSLPLAWSVKPSTFALGTDILPGDPNTGPATGPGNKFQWLFVQDKQTPAIPDSNTLAFFNGQDYSRIVDARGIQFSQATFGGGPGLKSSFLYFEVNLNGALPYTYRTTALVFEAFTQ